MAKFNVGAIVKKLSLIVVMLILLIITGCSEKNITNKTKNDNFITNKNSNKN